MTERLLRTALPAAAMALALAAPAMALDIALIRSGDNPAYTQAIAAFKKASLSGDVMEADVQGIGSFEPAVLQKLKAAAPKVMVAFGNPAAKAARDAGLGGSVIYALVVAPDRMALTGPSIGGISADLPAKVRLQVLMGLSPGIKKVGVLHDAGSGAILDALVAAAAELGLTIVASPVTGPTSLPPTVRQLMPQADAILVIPDPALGAPESVKFVMKSALEANKPTLSWSDQHFSLGAVMVLTPSPEESGRVAAELAGKALKGDASFATMVTPQELRTSVNVRAAQNIGITVDTTGATLDGNFASRTGALDPPPMLGVKGATAIAAAPPTPPPATAVASGGSDADPRVLESASAEYPPMARKQKMEGQVVLEVRVGADGTVQDAKVLRGSSLFNESATATIKRYKFAPARRGGLPVEGNVQVTIYFKL